ncbi:MAG: NHL repeat-containing protein, partial [Acidobacteriaceae bacterium]
TAASVWALEQFIGSGINVGATSSNVAGLRNAFLTVSNLVDNSKGTAPGPSLPANTVLETTKINALADILWACNQSSTGSACQDLFAAATEGSSTPSDTLDAALNIIRNPAAQVGAIFALLTVTPFQPVLSAAPHDWTLSATYGNCTSGCGGLNLPGSLAIDSKGNVWVANYFGGAASEFSNTGIPASPNGYAATGLQESFGIAVDAQDSVWITNENGPSSQGTATGSVTHLSNTGENLSGAGYTGGGIYYPIAVAATSGGNIWVADHANSTATLLAADGAAISGTSGYAPSALPFTTAVAVDAAQNGWFAYQGGVAKVTPAGAVSAFSCCDVPAGIALDASGNLWIADYDASSVVELSSSGDVLGQAVMTGGVETPVGIAIDGAGHVWTANYRVNTLSEFDGAHLQALSPAAGFGQDASLYGPFGAAIDASGNLWISNAYGNTLTEFIGVASPVKTPLLGPPAQP